MRLSMIQIQDTTGITRRYRFDSGSGKLASKFVFTGTYEEFDLLRRLFSHERSFDNYLVQCYDSGGSMWTFRKEHGRLPLSATQLVVGNSKPENEQAIEQTAPILENLEQFISYEEFFDSQWLTEYRVLVDGKAIAQPLSPQSRPESLWLDRRIGNLRDQITSQFGVSPELQDRLCDDLSKLQLCLYRWGELQKLRPEKGGPPSLDLIAEFQDVSAEVRTLESIDVQLQELLELKCPSEDMSGWAAKLIDELEAVSRKLADIGAGEIQLGNLQDLCQAVGQFWDNFIQQHQQQSHRLATATIRDVRTDLNDIAEQLTDLQATSNRSVQRLEEIWREIRQIDDPTPEVTKTLAWLPGFKAVVEKSKDLVAVKKSIEAIIVNLKSAMDNVGQFSNQLVTRVPEQITQLGKQEEYLTTQYLGKKDLEQPTMPLTLEHITALSHAIPLAIEKELLEHQKNYLQGVQNIYRSRIKALGDLIDLWQLGTRSHKVADPLNSPRQIVSEARSLCSTLDAKKTRLNGLRAEIDKKTALADLWEHYQHQLGKVTADWRQLAPKAVPIDSPETSDLINTLSELAAVGKMRSLCETQGVPPSALSFWHIEDRHLATAEVNEVELLLCDDAVGNQILFSNRENLIERLGARGCGRISLITEPIIGPEKHPRARVKKEISEVMRIFAGKN